MYFKNWESSTDQQHKFLIDLVYFSGQRKNDKQMKKLYSLPGDNKYVEKIKQAKSERRFAGSRDHCHHPMTVSPQRRSGVSVSVIPEFVSLHTFLFYKNLLLF